MKYLKTFERYRGIKTLVFTPEQIKHFQEIEDCLYQYDWLNDFKHGSEEQRADIKTKTKIGLDKQNSMLSELSDEDKENFRT